MLNERVLFLGAAIISCVVGLFGASAKEYSSSLASHIVLEAKSFIKAPEDAPKSLKISGKYATLQRTDKVFSVEGLSDGRPTNVFSPFEGQPLQGHSGIKYMEDGTLWLLTDNGMGSKANSPDFMLYLNHYSVDFKNGKLKLLETIFLHDEDKKIPFHIVNEGSVKRYLTGADFDTESFQIANNVLWIGDEFGPYLIKADMNGKILAIFETLVDGKVIHSPDHYAIKTPDSPGDKNVFEVKRSKGFEGMAMSDDKLYALLEGALYGQNGYENDNKQEYLRILEFDIKNERWSGNFWKYPLEKNGNAIGDFNMISKDRGLVIERDNGEGIVEKACQIKQDKSSCFGNLPLFKRIYLIKLDHSNMGRNVEKIAYIDLLNIQDPNKLSRKPLSEGVFKFPFFTIENVDIVDKNHIIVGNDNNLPFSSSREPNLADDNELILLDVGDFLNAN
ncbi:MAG: esterase-like activity of phytase family protein [Campylobacteraceae bacterium]|jgi:hypothetical protein|nr:esterase-like activity of phytase family protein [Campylobacteraceae bacterium]